MKRLECFGVEAYLIQQELGSNELCQVEAECKNVFGAV
jgi:hypothetical protein